MRPLRHSTSILVYRALVILCCFSLPAFASAQWVKFIQNPLQAKYRVYETRQRLEATHWVYRVSKPEDVRKGGEWYVVANPQLFSKAMTLFRVARKEEADIIVYYVSTRDSAMIRLRAP